MRRRHETQPSDAAMARAALCAFDPVSVGLHDAASIWPGYPVGGVGFLARNHSRSPCVASPLPLSDASRRGRRSIG
jgi:hypothetical protein